MNNPTAKRRLPSAALPLLLCFSVVFAQPDDRLNRVVNQYSDATIKLREQIHQYPELGNREFKTAELIANHLRSLGMEVTTNVAHTGVIGLLRGGRPGTVVAVRADMDALPVTEATSYPFKSEVRTTYLGKEVGVMHACGHDVHTAVQMGVASVLAELRDQIPGTIKFIFQPAEEGPPPGEEGGAELMVREGTLENPRPSAIFGLHTFSGMEAGKFAFTPGPALAAVDHFIIKVRGRQAHGARPEESVDPIVMASQAVMALQTIRSRNLDALQPSVVTVGIFRGGERFNIIPAEVHLEGTVRTYNADIRDKVEKRMGEIVQGITQAHGGSFELDYQRGDPVTINDLELTELSVPVLNQVFGKENVIQTEPSMGGEDFAYFANEVPAFFFRVGVAKPGTVSGGHHTPTFAADNSSVPLGMLAMSSLLLDYLERSAEE